MDEEMEERLKVESFWRGYDFVCRAIVGGVALATVERDVDRKEAWHGPAYMEGARKAIETYKRNHFSR